MHREYAAYLLAALVVGAIMWGIVVPAYIRWVMLP